MSTDKKKLENANTQQESRRKIVKGLAGLPAMVTLASGAANAATSSQCIVDNATALDAQVTANTGNPTPTRDCVAVGTGPGEAYEVPGSPAGVYETAPGTPMRMLAPDNPGKDDACVVFVDEEATPLTHDINTVGDPVTSSCYTSFTVAGP